MSETHSKSSKDKEEPEKKRRRMNNSQQQLAEEKMKFTTTTPYILENSNQTAFTYFVDCSIIINPSEINNNNTHQQHSSSQTTTYEWMKSKLKSTKRKNIDLKGKLTKIAGKDWGGFDNPSTQNARFYLPYFLKYNPSSSKLYISENGDHIIRSINNISMNNNGKWNGELEIEVGQPKQRGGYCNGNRNTCKLREPSGFDWDMNGNMYICNSTCVCKVDSKSNQVSLVAGHATGAGYKDGNNYKARFDNLTGILCYQLNYQSPILLYVCDYYNHCIRMIDVTNSKTTTFDDYEDETLQSARIFHPWDIVKDDEDDDILYVSDYGNHDIKMIDVKIGMVTTLVGDENDKSILNCPSQIQIVDSFIYVACFGFKDCIVNIDKHSKKVTKIKFNDGKKLSTGMYGITYHELDQCFYISHQRSIYRLE